MTTWSFEYTYVYDTISTCLTRTSASSTPSTSATTGRPTSTGLKNNLVLINGVTTDADTTRSHGRVLPRSSGKHLLEKYKAAFLDKFL